MPGEFTRLYCPRCGSHLLSDGQWAWCSYVGGHNDKACSYGIDECVTLLTALMDQKYYNVAQSQGRALAKLIWLEILEPKYASSESTKEGQ